MSDPIGKKPRLTSADKMAVDYFAKEMLKKLDANTHKDHWRGYPNSFFVRRIEDELAELKDALTDWKTEDAIVSECADIANFAMMIADNMRFRNDVRKRKEKRDGTG